MGVLIYSQMRILKTNILPNEYFEWDQIAKCVFGKNIYCQLHLLEDRLWVAKEVCGKNMMPKRFRLPYEFW